MVVAAFQYLLLYVIKCAVADHVPVIARIAKYSKDYWLNPCHDPILNAQ